MAVASPKEAAGVRARRAGTVRDYGRWQLTPIQRLLVVLPAVSAMFLSAMAWGWKNLGLLLVALFLVVGTGLGVFMLGLRYNGRTSVQGSAYVMMAQPPPLGKIVGRCEMRLRVDLPGGSSTMVKLHDPSVPVIKWPRVGTVLPVEVASRNPRQLRVRWELVGAHHSRALSPAEEATAFAVPFYTDYAEETVPPDGPPGAVAPVNNGGPTMSAAVLDEDPSPTTGMPASNARATDPAPDLDATVHTGPLRHGDQAVEGDTVAKGASAPAAPYVFVPDAVAEASAQAAEYELPVRGIPQPRSAESSLIESPPGATGARATASEAEAGAERPAPDRDAQAMGIMLIVSDLSRSLRFYGDLLGVTVVDRTSGSAVLAYGGGRILLRQVADMSPVDRRVVHLHIQVADVEASYQDLRAKGVEFVHRPRVMSRGNRLELWAATFRDPDGHAIALTQWRDREGGPSSGAALDY